MQPQCHAEGEEDRNDVINIHQQPVIEASLSEIIVSKSDFNIEKSPKMSIIRSVQTDEEMRK